MRRNSAPKKRAAKSNSLKMTVPQARASRRREKLDSYCATANADAMSLPGIDRFDFRHSSPSAPPGLTDLMKTELFRSIVTPPPLFAKFLRPFHFSGPEPLESRIAPAAALAFSAANELLQFDTATPGTITKTTPITGLIGGDTVLGIDVRPTTGELFAVGSGNRLYTVDLATGAASLRATLSAAPGDDNPFTGFSGTAFGVDFNPVPDLAGNPSLRVVNDTDQNMRINVANGQVTTDTNINPAAITLSGSAYTNIDLDPATGTTLFGIDVNANSLVTTANANGGTYAPVGNGLGIGDVISTNGFDIQTIVGTNSGFAALQLSGINGSSLYTIDFTTGAATLVGAIGSTPTEVRGLAILTTVSDAPATVFGVDASGNLVRFKANAPGTSTSLPITGLVGGAAEAIVGLDFRPATGVLYALTQESPVGRLYTIDQATGTATFRATLTADPTDTTAPYSGLIGSRFGVDFNPVSDRLRAVSNSDQNLRINVDAGLVITDDPLNPGNPTVVGSAYINNTHGTTTTTLYGIDAGTDALVLQNPPNNGIIATVGTGLAIGDISDVVGFDVRTAGGTNRPLAAMTVGAVQSLYSINLSTGIATSLGPTPTVLVGLAIAPEGLSDTTLSGTTATFNGGSAAENIVFDQTGGLLRHNRFSAGDPGFNSDFDFDPIRAGDQTLSATDPAVVIGVNGAGNDDRITIIARQLAGSFQINGGAGADTLVVDDSASTLDRIVTINGATRTVTGIAGAITHAAVESLTVNGGTGNDTINLEGNQTALTSVNTGGGDDRVVFGADASISGLLDGGAGANTLDYTNYTAAVTVDLSATQTLFLATISAAQEPGPLSSSPAAGIGVFTLNADQTALGFHIAVQDLVGATVTGNHFHNSAAGTNGPIVRGLTVAEQIDLTPPDELLAGVWRSTDPDGTGGVPSSGPLTPTFLAELLANRIYFNTHTNLFPSGEARGQLLNQSTVALATGTSGVRGFVHVTGGSGDDTITGAPGANVLSGGPGADTIIGRQGGDTLNGGEGDDLLVWNNGDGSDVMNGDAGTDTVQVNGSPTSGDQFLIQVNPADSTRLRFDRTNLGLFNLDIGTIEALDFNTLGGDDTTTVDFAGGNPIPVNGIDFDGGTGDDDTLATDTLVLQRSAGTFTAANEVYTPSGPDSGTILLDNALITFANLTPINDTVPVSNFTFNAPANAPRIALLDGPVVGGDATAQLASPTGAFELISFANKTNTTVNTTAGDDTVRLDNPTPSSGNTSLTVNLGSGDDRLNLDAAAIPSLIFNGQDGNDLFFVVPQPASTVSVDGGSPSETPGDLLEYNVQRGTATVGDGTISGPGVMPVNFSAIERALVSNNGLRQINSKTVGYRDFDGDNVTIKVKRGAINIADFQLARGNTVDGTQLQTIDLASEPEFAKTNLKLTAQRDPVRGGDSVAHVGLLDATGIRLGKVKLNGDLGRVLAGDDPTATAIKSLTVQSIGSFGTATQDPGSAPSNASVVTGRLASLTVSTGVFSSSISATRFGVFNLLGDLLDSSIRAQGIISPTSTAAAQTIKSFSVGGDVNGSEILAGYNPARLAVNADVQIGKVRVGGNWIASDLAVGATAGADTFFGTADDALITVPPGNQIIARIAKIQIRGLVRGETPTGTERFGFVAEEIRSLLVDTSPIELEFGPSNDNLTADDPRYAFGPAREVVVREV